MYFLLFYAFSCCSMYCLCCSMHFYVVLCIVCFVSFSVLFVCIFVLYYCHRVVTQLQLTNISYHIILQTPTCIMLVLREYTFMLPILISHHYQFATDQIEETPARCADYCAVYKSAPILLLHSTVMKTTTRYTYITYGK
jgi:hypothetical protein